MSNAWHVISEPDLLELLRRCENGEPADTVYAEHYANANHQPVAGDDNS
jgi:hypothetical protein